MRSLDPQWQSLEMEVEALVEQEGCELVLLEVLGHPGQHLVRVRVDKPGGVTVGDCERISHRLSAFLDIVDPFPRAFRLEVSSPGVERPLVKRQDFDRFAGQRVSISFLEEGGRKRTVTGTLGGCQGTVVEVEVKGERVEVPVDSILDAHLRYDWDAEAAPGRI